MGCVQTVKIPQADSNCDLRRTRVDEVCKSAHRFERFGIMEACDPSELPSERVSADLRRRIESGEWASGDMLPTVAEVAERYGVARGTVASALRTLEADRLVRIVPRWGTFRV